MDYHAVVAQWREPRTKTLHRSILHTSPSKAEANEWAKVHCVGTVVKVKSYHPPTASVRQFRGSGVNRRMVTRKSPRTVEMVG
jgi:hypothetical protein